MIQTILTYGEFKFVRIKGHVLFKGWIIANIGWGNLIFFSRTTVPKTRIYIKAFWCRANRNLSKSWSLGVRRGHNLGKTFLCNLVFEKKSLLENYFSCVFKGRIIKQNPQDPLYQKSSNLQRSFLLKCKDKFHMMPWPPELVCSHNKENFFRRCWYGKNWPKWFAMWSLSLLLFCFFCCFFFMVLQVVRYKKLLKMGLIDATEFFSSYRCFFFVRFTFRQSILNTSN
jgi:hypothetical protein